MKTFFCSVILLLLYSRIIYSQEQNKKHSVNFISGVVLVDGFTYSKSVPTLGLGYEYKLSKLFSISVNLMSVYKTLQDPTLILNTNSFNIITRKTNSLFISQEIKDRITNIGIKDISSENTVKFLYLPLGLSLNFQPIKFGKSNLGFCIGSTAKFGSYKASRDQFSIDITLNDGTKYENLNFKQEIEFRNLIIGSSYSKLYYKYSFNQSCLLLSLHSYNFLWTYNNTETFHLLTIEFSSNF